MVRVAHVGPKKASISQRNEGFPQTLAGDFQYKK